MLWSFSGLCSPTMVMVSGVCVLYVGWSIVEMCLEGKKNVAASIVCINIIFESISFSYFLLDGKEGIIEDCNNHCVVTSNQIS